MGLDLTPKFNCVKELRVARSESGPAGRPLSQQRLADLTGMPRNRLTRLEREESFATPAERRAIAAVLSRIPTKAYGRRRVTPLDTGLKVHPLGATRGRRTEAEEELQPAV
jgi:transcriptional regulator with XRE-family HTH domain